MLNKLMAKLRGDFALVLAANIFRTLSLLVVR